MASAPVIQLPRAAGKGAQPAAIQQLRDAQDEITALRAERISVATEVEALSRRMQLAVLNDRPDLALHVAGRLDALAHSLHRRDAA